MKASRRQQIYAFKETFNWEFTHFALVVAMVYTTVIVACALTALTLVGAEHMVFRGRNGFTEIHTSQTPGGGSHFISTNFVSGDPNVAHRMFSGFGLGAGNLGGMFGFSRPFGMGALNPLSMIGNIHNSIMGMRPAALFKRSPIPQEQWYQVQPSFYERSQYSPQQSNWPQQ